jgi:hypothetical protein
VKEWKSDFLTELSDLDSFSLKNTMGENFILLVKKSLMAVLFPLEKPTT